MYALKLESGNKLNELDNMGALLPKPEVYGTFENDKHYLSTLDLLLASSLETQNRYDFFVDNILPYVTTQSMIDIGIGDGKLTELAGKEFQDITIVDPSIHALDTVGQCISHRNKNLSKIVGSIVDIELPESKFNLAILSHTLYYIDTNLWMDVTTKILASLKENGLLVIVLNGGLDKDLAADAFGGQPLDIAQFITNCREQLNVQSIDVAYSTEYFQTQSLNAMLHIAGLHLYDVGARATKEQLTDFLIMKRDRLTQLYQFLVYQKFIVIRK